MAPPNDQQTTTSVSPSGVLNFDSIQGHQLHTPAQTGGRGVSPQPVRPTPQPVETPTEPVTISSRTPVIETQHAPPVEPGDEYDLGGKEIMDAVSYLRDRLEGMTQAGKEQHPVLAKLGETVQAAHELLSGGQAAGKPMGTSGGVLDEAQILSGAADAPEQLEEVVNAAQKYGAKAADYLSETFGGVPEEWQKIINARTPVGRESEAGHIPFDFSHIEGHEVVKPVQESVEKKSEIVPTVAPNEQSTASAQRYNAAHGMPAINHAAEELPPAENRAAFADTYDAAKHEPENPEVQHAYNAMKQETLNQFNHAKNDLGINFEFTKEDPYKNAEEMMADVRNNHRLKVYTGGDLPKDHPLAEIEPTTGQTYNNLFRATHDIFGHTAGGHDFTEGGEYNAFNAHNQMYSDEAKPAVRTETLGQSNWVSNNKDVREGRSPQYSRFAEQKATILPDAPGTHEPADEGSIKDTVETAGGVYRGTTRAVKGEPGIVEITLPPEMTDKLNVRPEMKKHISVNLPENEVTEENVRAALERKFKEFGGNPADLQPKSELQQLKEVYPTTTDPSVALRGASFVTPEGEFMPLGAGDEHFKAIEKTRPPDTSAPRNKQVMQSREKLPNFLEDNNLVRMRFLQGRAGSDLHVTVPQNITPDAVQAIRQAVGKNRNGNMIIETTTPGLNSSRMYQFASPADVDKALHDLGVHPESWSNKAVKMMQEQPAGGINPRTGKTDESGFGVEVFPEARAAREPLNHLPTKADVEGFYEEHKELFDKHPELRVGWDKTDKGWELNIGAAAANQAGAELVGRNLDQREAWDIAGQKPIPTGGKGEKTKFGQYPLEERLADLSGKNVAKLPPTIKNSRHLTDSEKYLLGSNAGALKGFKDTKKKIASVQELAETAKAGEANRFWYDRARAAFGTMFDSLPKNSFPEEDRDKFIGLVAATSPRSDVTENLAASLDAYRAWVQEGRPTNPIRVREAIDSSLMMPSSHGPNATRALTEQELSGPKVTSFLKNFMGSQQHVTNDMWGALTNGIMDAKELSNPGSYIALSENYRKAAESLGWTPQQAQAASWGFVRTLGNMAGFGGKQAGANKPAEAILGMIDDPTVRKYSADIADIFLTSGKVRDRLESLGINLEEFDARLNKAIEPYGRGGEGQTRGTNPKLLARTAEKVEQGKRYAQAQAAAGKNINEKAMPLLEGTLGKESGTKRPRKR